MKTRRIERDRLGNPILDCEVCHKKLIRKPLIIKPWGHAKKIMKPYCLECKKYRHGEYRYKIVDWSFTKKPTEENNRG